MIDYTRVEDDVIPLSITCALDPIIHMDLRASKPLTIQERELGDCKLFCWVRAHFHASALALLT